MNKIVIVGGGTSGWFTAAAIAKNLPEVDLTLIESSDIPTIGVGESTIQSIRLFFDECLGIDVHDFLKEVDGTLKVSIAFSNFSNQLEKFQYPFGDVLLHNQQIQFSVEDYENTCLQESDLSFVDLVNYGNDNSLLAEYNKLPAPTNSFDYQLFTKNCAFHFDASKMAIFLKNKFCSNITHIQATIAEEQVEVDEDGIQSIHLNDGTEITADLFIDCTGFKSLLLEKKLGVSFNNFDFLVNDSAIAARIPYQNEIEQKEKIHNTTLCTAVEEGWTWEIPLWNRLGAGYVYSSQFTSREKAELDFRNKFNWTGPVNYISFRHGFHEKMIYKNVAAIGLSYGFIEPLESTGLVTTHNNILLLLDEIMKNRSSSFLNSISKEGINGHSRSVIKGFADFIFTHYVLTNKDYNAYWKHMTQKAFYSHPDSDVYVSSLNKTIPYHGNNVIISREHLGPYCISNGFNPNSFTFFNRFEQNVVKDFDRRFSNNNYHSYLKAIAKEIRNYTAKRRKQILDSKDFVSTYDYLKNEFYA